MSKGLMSTAGEALKSGAVSAATKKAFGRVRKLLVKKLGPSMPVLHTPAGQRVLDFLIPAFLHGAVDILEEKEMIPESSPISADHVREACSVALTSVTRETVEEAMPLIFDLLGELAAAGAAKITAGEDKAQIGSEFDDEEILEDEDAPPRQKRPKAPAEDDEEILHDESED